MMMYTLPLPPLDPTRLLTARLGSSNGHGRRDEHHWCDGVRLRFWQIWEGRTYGVVWFKEWRHEVVYHLLTYFFFTCGMK